LAGGARRRRYGLGRRWSLQYGVICIRDPRSTSAYRCSRLMEVGVSYLLVRLCIYKALESESLQLTLTPRLANGVACALRASGRRGGCGNQRGMPCSHGCRHSNEGPECCCIGFYACLYYAMVCRLVLVLTIAMHVCWCGWGRGTHCRVSSVLVQQATPTALRLLVSVSGGDASAPSSRA